MSANSIVLAGGKGLRLGGEKAWIEIGGGNLLQRVISRLGFLCSDIILVIAEKQKPPKVVNYAKLKIVTDVHAGRGPLMGIYSGLLNSDSTNNFIVACDMPFLNKHLISYMLDVSIGFDITIPKLGNVVEPLHSVYSKSCLEAIAKLLVENNLKIDSLLKMVKVRYVEAEELDSFDPEHLSFFNINTKADLTLAREMVERAV